MRRHANPALKCVTEREKKFFFEKKNQKTLVHEARVPARVSKKLKVFCFFFSKKKVFLFTSNVTVAPH
jgi:hypothetical protein